MVFVVFFQLIPITNNYLLFMVDTNRINGNFTLLYFKKKFITCYAHLRVSKANMSKDSNTSVLLEPIDFFPPV